MTSPYDYSARHYDFVSTNESQSPLQLRRPPPMGSFDREPVMIPIGHPLAEKAAKTLPPSDPVYGQPLAASTPIQKEDPELIAKKQQKVIPSKKTYTMKTELNEARNKKEKIINDARHINTTSAHEVREKFLEIERGLQSTKKNTHEGSAEASQLVSKLSSTFSSLVESFNALPVLVHTFAKKDDPVGRVMRETVSYMENSGLDKYFTGGPIKAVPPPTESSSSVPQTTPDTSIRSVDTAFLQGTLGMDSPSSASFAHFLRTSDFASIYDSQEEGDVFATRSREESSFAI